MKATIVVPYEGKVTVGGEVFEVFVESRLHAKPGIVLEIYPDGTALVQCEIPEPVIYPVELEPSSSSGPRLLASNQIIAGSNPAEGSKLAPELSRITIAYLEAVDNLRRCPGCGRMRYLSNMYLCSNPGCNFDDPK